MTDLSKKKNISRSFFTLGNIEFKKNPQQTKWNVTTALLSYTLEYIIMYFGSIMYYDHKGNDISPLPSSQILKTINKKYKEKE